MAIVASKPIRTTSIQYSSDRRIKRDVEYVDTLDLLQRMKSVRLRRYRYTDAWRQYREIDDETVRGVIAQDLQEVFPEHVRRMDVDPGAIGIDNFLQVDKQGLTLDLIGALQAHEKRFRVVEATELSSGDVAISSANAVKSEEAGHGADSSGQISAITGTSVEGDSGMVTIASGVSAAGATGNASLLSGASSKGPSGKITMASGGAGADSGMVSLVTGTSSNGNSGAVSIRTGNGDLGSSGDLNLLRVLDAVTVRVV